MGGYNEKIVLKFNEIKQTDLEGNFFGGNKINWISYAVEAINNSNEDIQIRIFGVNINKNVEAELQFLVFNIRFPFILESNESRCISISGEKLQCVLKSFIDEIDTKDYLTFYIEDYEGRKYEVRSSMKIENILHLESAYYNN